MAEGSNKLHALVRSLNLLPYFRNHPGTSPMEAATDLGMTPEELRDSINRLFCSGVGRNTEDLIDLSFSYRDGVEIYNDQGLNQALRLTPTEAGALLLTLESLEDMPGLIDTTAVHSAAAKLRAIMDDKTAAIYDSLSQGEQADTVNGVAGSGQHEESATQKLLAQAVEQRRRVEFDYWSASRNAESHRVVDPARIFIVEDEPYLVAWDDEVSDHRRFRIDRMRNVEMREDKAQPRLRQLQFDANDPFGLGKGQRVQLEIHPEFMWLANFYNIELGETLDNGCVAAEMPIGSEEWFIRFAISQADRLRVVGPESLVNAVADRGARGNERYTREDPL